MDWDSLMDCQEPRMSQKEGQEDQVVVKELGTPHSFFEVPWSCSF